MHLAAAGSTEIPAYLALLARGYIVSCSADGETWTATKNGNEFNADGPLPLLGLVAMVEQRGAHWQASDAEIDAFMARFQLR